MTSGVLECFVTSGVLERSAADIQAVRLEEVGEDYAVDVPSAARMLFHNIFVEYPILLLKSPAM